MVFTTQVAALNNLYGVVGVPAELVDTLIQTFGNCAQSLTHEGPVTLNNVNGVNIWMKAQSDWVNALANGSYVVCNQVGDKDGGTGSSDAVTNVKVYLPRTGGNVDPSVWQGDVISATKDKAGTYSAIGSYCDDAIGTLKQWVGDVSSIRKGWRQYSSASGKFLREGSPGASGGNNSHTHTAHASLSGITIDLSGTTIDPATIELPGFAGGSFPTGPQSIFGAGFVPTTPASLSVTDSGTATASLSGATVDRATTGISVEAPGHTHTVTDSPNNCLNGAGTNVAKSGTVVVSSVSAAAATVTDLGHVHGLTGTVSLDISGLTFNIDPRSHDHDVPVAGIAAGLGVTPGVVNIPSQSGSTSSHTHTLSDATATITDGTVTVNVDSADNIPEYFSAYMIERYK